MTANSTIKGLIWPNFEPMRAFMVVLVTCKNDEIQSKMKALEWSQDYLLIFKCSRAANSEVRSDGILPKFQLIRAFMVGLVT